MDNTFTKDFEQKRRNRPVAITDIAISKIRKTKFTGFTTQQEEMIQELHKLALREAKALNEKLNTNYMETGILVDLHTWQYWIIHGKKVREVEMKNNKEAYEEFEKAKKNQMMFIHNHPSTGTFSGEDFKFFCMHEQFYMATVVGNNGTVYAL